MQNNQTLILRKCILFHRVPFFTEDARFMCLAIVELIDNCIIFIYTLFISIHLVLISRTFFARDSTPHLIYFTQDNCLKSHLAYYTELSRKRYFMPSVDTMLASAQGIDRNRIKQIVCYLSIHGFLVNRILLDVKFYGFEKF